MQKWKKLSRWCDRPEGELRQPHRNADEADDSRFYESWVNWRVVGSHSRRVGEPQFAFWGCKPRQTSSGKGVGALSIWTRKASRRRGINWMQKGVPPIRYGFENTDLQQLFKVSVGLFLWKGILCFRAVIEKFQNHNKYFQTSYENLWDENENIRDDSGMRAM
jgi:hypothetical protein